MTVDFHRGLTGPWLAVRLGAEPVALEIRRRNGELFAVRVPGSEDWLYPSWQFDDEGQVRPHVARALAAAHDAGLSQAQLEALLRRRVGLAGGLTMVDLLVEGDDRPLVSAIKSSR